MYIMLARQGEKNTSYEERARALHFVKSNLELICESFGLDIDGDVLTIGDRKYFVHASIGIVIEIKD